MQSNSVDLQTVTNTPAPRLRRRLPPSDSVASVIVEHLLAERIRVLGDRGESLDAAWQEARR